MTRYGAWVTVVLSLLCWAVLLWLVWVLAGCVLRARMEYDLAPPHGPASAASAASASE